MNIDEEKILKNDIYYEQQLDNETYKIINLIMANEFSEAGDYYNNFAIQYIKNHLNLFSDISEFFLPVLLIENFIELSNLILNQNIDKSNFNISKIERKIIIKCNEKISYKKHLDYQLQTFNLYNNIIVPKYRYYINNNQFIVELEVSGKTKEVKCDYILENEYYIFNFSGQKIDELKNNLEIKDYYISTKNEIFILNLTISSDNINLISDNYNFEDCGNGILSFKFELHQKSKNKKIYE